MKEITVFINGTPKTVEKRDYTFVEVVKLAGYDKVHIEYTMSSTIKEGNDHHLYSIGDKIKMKENMRINVDLTNNA